MKEWRWIDAGLANAIHELQLSEHGGIEGVRDQGAIDSALARPRNLVEHENPDAADVAAAYCWGIVKNHGYADGNKRTGWILARLFLADNGVRILFDPVEVVPLIERVAGGQVTEVELAAWMRAHVAASPAR